MHEFVFYALYNLSKQSKKTKMFRLQISRWLWPILGYINLLRQIAMYICKKKKMQNRHVATIWRRRYNSSEKSKFFILKFKKNVCYDKEWGAPLLPPPPSPLPDATCLRISSNLWIKIHFKDELMPLGILLSTQPSWTM